jgi:hypothetical protein
LLSFTALGHCPIPKTVVHSVNIQFASKIVGEAVQHPAGGNAQHLITTKWGVEGILHERT